MSLTGLENIYQKLDHMQVQLDNKLDKTDDYIENLESLLYQQEKYLQETAEKLELAIQHNANSISAESTRRKLVDDSIIDVIIQENTDRISTESTRRKLVDDSLSIQLQDIKSKLHVAEKTITQHTLYIKKLHERKPSCQYSVE